MNTTNKLPGHRSKFNTYKKRVFPFTLGYGFYFLMGVIILLAVLGGLNTKGDAVIYAENSIAKQTVTAEFSFEVEDNAATKALKARLSQQRPVVFDLNLHPAENLQENISTLLKQLTSENDIKVETALAYLANFNSVDLTPEDITLLMSEEVQDFILTECIPWIKTQLAAGIIDSRQTLPPQNAIFIQYLKNGLLLHKPIYTVPSSPADVQIDFNRFLQKATPFSAQTRRAITTLLNHTIQPTLTYNVDATTINNQRFAETVAPVVYNIQKDETIIRQGERVTRKQNLALKKHWILQKREIVFDTFLGLILTPLLLCLGLFYSPSARPSSQLEQKDFFFIALLLLLAGVGAKALSAFSIILSQQSMLGATALIYAFPAAGFAGLAATVFSTRRFWVIALLIAFFGATIGAEVTSQVTEEASKASSLGSLSLFLCFFLSSLHNTWLVLRASTRQSVLWSIVPLTIGLLVITLSTALLNELIPFQDLFYVAGAVLINSVLSLVILLTFAPVAEFVFGYTTRFKLMEMMNLEQPLLQELMVATPGTYHHSLIVSNLVEAGCRAINANALLCKVAALYHDIGKLSRPEYFIENQYGQKNPHDKLTPSMSSLILISHIKHGLDLAKKHKLGKEIEELITQHHGTTTIRYFYHKAKEAGESPKEEDYQYPGPRPQTKEAAILMLADVIEASSRTLQDPTPARIAHHVSTIIKSIFTDGQLDESDLTLKDLNKLSNTFARLLTGIFHQRIAYPSEKPGTDKQTPEDKTDKADKADKPNTTEITGKAPVEENTDEAKPLTLA